MTKYKSIRQLRFKKYTLNQYIKDRMKSTSGSLKSQPHFQKNETDMGRLWELEDLCKFLKINK